MPNFIPRSQKLTKELSQQLRPNLIINYQKRKMEQFMRQLQSYQSKVHKIKTLDLSKRILFAPQNLILAMQNKTILDQINNQLVKWYLNFNRKALRKSQLSLLKQKINHLQSQIYFKTKNMSKIIMKITSEGLEKLDSEIKQQDECQDNHSPIQSDGSIQSNPNLGQQRKIFIQSEVHILQNSDFIPQRESSIKKEPIRKTDNLMFSEGSAIKQEGSIQQPNQDILMKSQKGQIKAEIKMKETVNICQNVSSFQLSQDSGNY